MALNFPDQTGNACQLVLTFDEASSSAMTLSRSLKRICTKNIATALCVISIHYVDTP
jgi:hypothetical protein